MKVCVSPSFKSAKYPQVMEMISPTIIGGSTNFKTPFHLLTLHKLY